jgi:multiple sugar transport system ATP-binding protein
VTHDQVEAMTLADRIVVMHDGRIEQVGAPMELFLNPVNTFVAGFIGSPPMNQFEASVEQGSNGLVARLAGQAIPLPPLHELDSRIGDRVIVGIRPEHANVRKPTQAAITVELDLVETLGSEALLHTTLGDNAFIIKTETDGDIDFLNRVSAFSVDPARIKVFDAATGAALRH